MVILLNKTHTNLLPTTLPPKKMDFYMKTDPPFHPETIPSIPRPSFQTCHSLGSGLPFLGLGRCLGQADCHGILGWCHDPSGWRWGTLWLAGSTSGTRGGPVEVIYLIGGFLMVPKSWGGTKMSLVVQLMIYSWFLSFDAWWLAGDVEH